MGRMQWQERIIVDPICIMVMPALEELVFRFRLYLAALLME